VIFERADWMQFAECRGMDPAYFHPTKGVNINHIRQVCDCCPVIEPCREMGIADHTLQGVLGGMSERERRNERQRRRISQGLPGRLVYAQCGTAGGYRKHRRRFEDACSACLEAHREAEKRYNANRRMRA
jgi:WhiB family redox-sensing transcriptional regulator